MTIGLVFQMSGKGNKSDHPGISHKGRRWRAPSHADWLMREATTRSNSSHPPPEDEGIGSDDDLIQEIEGYSEANEVEEIAHPQGAEGNLPLET